MSRDHRAFACELHADAETLVRMARALDERATSEDRETFAGELRRDAEGLREMARSLRIRALEEERFAKLLQQGNPAIAREAERVRTIRDAVAGSAPHIALA